MPLRATKNRHDNADPRRSAFFFVFWLSNSDGLRPHMHLPTMSASNALRGGKIMAMLTIRNLPDEVHRALRVRAAKRGHSTEAEVREILASAVRPEARVQMGDALAALGRQIGLANEDIDALNDMACKIPAEPPRLE